jgi:transposase-like protein
MSQASQADGSALDVPNHATQVPQFERTFPNEEACDAFLVARRWPNGVRCPRCGSDRAYPLASMKYKWECPDCRQGGAYRFSHLVGTIFENTKIDLKEWFRVIHLMLTAKKGLSARQVHVIWALALIKPLGTCAIASAPLLPIPNSASSWAL